MVGPTDKVAKVAAALFHAGDAASLRVAIEIARMRSGGGDGPSMSNVRRHLEALEQSTSGEVSWALARLKRLDAVVELVRTLAFLEPNGVCYVVGRAAEGFVDDTAPAHVRLVGGHAAAVVVDALESHGFPPCEVSSLSTRLGSVAVAHLDAGAAQVDLMMLASTPVAHAAVNVVDGRPVALVDEAGFAKLIDEARGDAFR